MSSRQLMGVPLLASIAPTSGWVPTRWNSTDAKSLDLLSCAGYEFRRGSAGSVPGLRTPWVALLSAMLRGIVTLAVRDMLADAHATVVELTYRARMPLGGPDP